MSAFDNFDPNSVGLKDNNIFGLPTTEENASLIIIPAPWEVTVSYRAGTSRGPEQIMEASLQIDLYDPDGIDAWKKGYYLLPVDKNIKKKSDYLRSCSELIISALSEGAPIDCNNQLCQKLKEVNEGGHIFKEWIKNLTLEYIEKGKTVVMVGGDHSTPLGYIQALATKHKDFGILQIDAHADLRIAYEGFTYSHASIMYNVLEEVPEVTKLVQVGIRDYCDEELSIINNNKRVQTFFDKDIKERLYEGDTWKAIVTDIVDSLPQKVYLSFDIDGLDPKLCPNTGTPVPGGFEVEQIFYLFKKLKESKREVIGFDLNEVSSGEHTHDCIDPLVGARVLYKMCNILMSQQ
ncbi:agmatinase [Taibaiella sp. KBW10]|uniref:agmatinase family protein n=1 Tax=Taibaiella sp. KBW10 TaxID=2153357 RepID=UPI000F5B5A91|nr:agmatinase family protein [Taibaiella sp. KBW10]RQO30593.1 agmatinase [Taibaiella sp. KBW10]